MNIFLMVIVSLMLSSDSATLGRDETFILKQLRRNSPTLVSAAIPAYRMRILYFVCTGWLSMCVECISNVVTVSACDLSVPIAPVLPLPPFLSTAAPLRSFLDRWLSGIACASWIQSENAKDAAFF
jgi:hypothetical protein